MRKRDEQDAVILLTKFRNSAKRNHHLDVNRDMMIYELNKIGFNNSEKTFVEMVKVGLIIRVTQGDYYMTNDATLDQMWTVILNLRRNSRNNMRLYRQRKLDERCAEYRKFLNRHGFGVFDMRIDGMSTNDGD